MTESESSTAIPPWVRRAILLWWGIGLGAAALWLLAILLRGLLIQFVVALFLSFALEPVVEMLMRRNIGRSASTAIALLGVLVITGFFLVAMGALVADQAAALADDLPDYVRDAQAWGEENLNIKIGTSEIIEQIQGTDLANRVLDIGTRTAGILFQVLTVSLFTFYLTADGPRFRQTVCSVFPPGRQTEILRVWELAINKTGAYISSRVVLALASAAFHWVVFQILGLPSAIALAIWVGVISQFIPAIGTYLAGVLPVLVALGQEPRLAIWVIVAVFAYQQVENYVLQPRITAQTLDLHPAVSIAAVLAGTRLFGAAGALMALPFVATASGFVSAYIERHEVIESRLTGPARKKSGRASGNPPRNPPENPPGNTRPSTGVT